MKTLLKFIRKSFLNIRLGISRFAVFVLFVLLAANFSLNAQSYSFVRGSFNAAGGMMQNSLYSSQIAVGEADQGSASTSAYTAYFGFLYPILDQRPPLITSIDDVPNDQGLQVQIVWNKCAFDDVYSQDSFYSIWRQDEDFDLILNDINEINQDLPDNVFTNPNEIIQLNEFQQENIYWLADDLLWTFLDTIPALQYDEYSYIAPTLIDSNSTAVNNSTFKVVFHDEFEYYESVAASGYSVDNIPPDPTENLVITLNESTHNTILTLSWDEVNTGTYAGNSYEEIGGIWYRIYASDFPNFECNESNLLATVTDTFYEFDVSNNSQHYFKIIVCDEP